LIFINIIKKDNIFLLKKESLIKDLNSTDSNKVIETMKRTDVYIDKLKNEPEIDEDGIKLKTGINKTFINTSQSDAEPISNEQARFMQVMEQDAKERQERRRENKRKADVLKQKGNAEFAQKNYQKAIEYYTEVFGFFFALS